MPPLQDVGCLPGWSRHWTCR